MKPEPLKGKGDKSDGLSEEIWYQGKDIRSAVEFAIQELGWDKEDSLDELRINKLHKAFEDVFK